MAKDFDAAEVAVMTLIAILGGVGGLLRWGISIIRSDRHAGEERDDALHNRISSAKSTFSTKSELGIERDERRTSLNRLEKIIETQREASHKTDMAIVAIETNIGFIRTLVEKQSAEFEKVVLALAAQNSQHPGGAGE